MVATDIAARGLDIEKLSLVVNFDLPVVPETYIHRIGRTGRAGLSGESILFCSEEEEGLLKDIERHIGKRVPVVENHRFSASFEKKEQRVAQKLPPPKQSFQKPQSTQKPQSNRKTSKPFPKATKRPNTEYATPSQQQLNQLKKNQDSDKSKYSQPKQQNKKS